MLLIAGGGNILNTPQLCSQTPRFPPFPTLSLTSWKIEKTLYHNRKRLETP